MRCAEDQSYKRVTTATAKARTPLTALWWYVRAARERETYFADRVLRVIHGILKGYERELKKCGRIVCLVSEGERGNDVIFSVAPVNQNAVFIGLMRSIWLFCLILGS